MHAKKSCLGLIVLSRKNTSLLAALAPVLAYLHVVFVRPMVNYVANRFFNFNF